MRWKAIEALGRLGSPQAIPALLECLTDPDTDVRWRAVEALGRLGSPQAVPAILERLTDLDTVVRRKAAQALGQLGSPQAIPAILERLTDQDADVRWSAAEALGRLGNLQAVPALLERLKDTDHNVRRATLFALGKIDLARAQEAATAVFVDPMEEGRVKALAAAILLNFNHQESLFYLHDLARSEFVADRRDTAVVLGSFSTTPAPAILTQLLQDDHLQVKTEAVTALGEIKATTTIPALARLVTDAAAETHVSLQRAAVTALSRMATDDSLRILRLAIANPDLSIPARLAALAALGASKAETAVASILKAAEQEETFLRLSAYKLLGERQLHQALPSLRQNLMQLREQYHGWRGIRDTAREDFTNEETEEWKKKVNTTRPPSYWCFDLAYAMARIDPEHAGIDLLAYDLGDVRQGAWMGLGEVGTVSLVQRLHRMRMESKAPLLRHALYRAIDHILIRIEGIGSIDDLAALQALLPHVREREEVYTRVEWTILRLERRYHDASAGNTNHQN